MEQRICHECGTVLKGRADQKFCNDMCRNAYNNKRLSKSTNFMRKVNRILKKNHSILETLNVSGKTTTLKSKLAKEGFSFEYFTSIYTTKTGKTYRFVYDQGYLELDALKILLVKNEEK